MAPYIDIYIRVPLDAAAVHAFLDKYAMGLTEPCTWFTYDGLTKLNDGLAGQRPPDDENLYLRSRRDLPLERVIIRFDEGGAAAVLGISVDESLPEDAAVEDPDVWLADLMQSTGATESFYACEYPPPLNLSEWQAAMSHFTKWQASLNSAPDQ